MAGTGSETISWSEDETEELTMSFFLVFIGFWIFTRDPPKCTNYF